MKVTTLRVRALLACSLGIGWTAGAWAQPPDGALQDRGARIRLRSATIDTRTEPAPAFLQAQPQGAALQDRYYIVQLQSPLTPQIGRRLREAGIQLGDYLPDNAYLVRMNDDQARSTSRLPDVNWVGRYRDEWKVDPGIGQRPIPFVTPRRALLEEIDQVQLVVTLFPGHDLEDAKEAISLTGADILGGTLAGDQGMIDVVADRALVQHLSRLPFVQYIEEAPEPVLRNDTTQWIIQSNQLDYKPIWAKGLHGEEQIGGLIDGQVRESHCSFDDDLPPGPDHRKLFYYAGAIGADTHGTHVAGTFAGDQPPYGVGDAQDGMAFAARFTFIPVNPIYDLPSSFINRLRDAHNPYGTGEGARVHTNSWGDDGTTAYTIWSRQVDLFSRENEEDLVCFAVTNGALLRTPENAKNVLAVAASRDAPLQDSHCSGGEGPTSDGRRKPEIFAPGCATLSSSASTTCGYTTLTGTSMASPAIAGAALLVRQYYMEGFYPSGERTPADAFTPTGALLRATLINAAVDMPNIAGYPSDQEGWGRLLLDSTLFFKPGRLMRDIPAPIEDDGRSAALRQVPSQNLFLDDVRNAQGLVTGQEITYRLNVVDNSIPLRVTLVWTDVPAAVGSSFAPVNDLDLTILAPNGSTYLGNDFDTALGESGLGGSRDDRNNVEQVHFLAPNLGAYTVTVSAFGVNQETQGYALIITGGIEVVPPDCNGNSVPDGEDIASGTSLDCNGNDRPDECEPDCDQDGIPNSCEGQPDCNSNNVPDDCDLADGTSMDCNNNTVPDECDLTEGASEDCDGNSIPDECDIAAGTSEDCNHNTVPDGCELSPTAVLTVFEIPVTPALQIPNSPVEGTHAFEVPITGAILDVDVDLDIDHSWNGDITCRITHDGQSATLLNRVGSGDGNQFGFSDQGFDVLLDDEAQSDIHDISTGGGKLTGTYQPDGSSEGPLAPSPLSVFDGHDATGTWTIILSDHFAAGDEGVINAWSLHLTTEDAPDSPDCNLNNVPDDCDIAAGTSQDANGDLEPDECFEATPGDCDEDGDVDLGDFLFFVQCFQDKSGPLLPGCDCHDVNGDDAVDLLDFATFVTLFNG